MKSAVIKEGKHLYREVFSKAGALLFAALALLYLFNVYYQWEYLSSVINGLCILSIIICFPLVKKSAGVVTLILVSLGAGLLSFSGADLSFWMESAGKNINLVTLLVLVPIFGVPLKYGEYYPVLDTLVNKYMNTRHRIYWVPALLTHFFGALMNMGAIPLTYQLVVRGELPSAFRSVPAAILRGFSSAIYWSPNMVSVALVTHYLDVSWAEFARLGLIVAILSLLIGWVIDTFCGREVFATKGHTGVRGEINKAKFLELIAFCVVFFGIIAFIATETTIPVLNAVPLLALAYPIPWLCLLGKGKGIYRAYKDYALNTLPRFISEIVLFLAVGFFAASLLYSGTGDKVSLLLYEFMGFSPYLLCLFVLSSVVFLSVLGVTPMVTVMAYAASLNPDLIGISPQLLALVLVGGWATSIIVSPFTGVTLIVAGLTAKSPFAVARGNWLFAGIMVLLLSMVSLF